MANVVAGEGTTISIGGSTILQVVSIDGPSWSVESVEKTHLASTDKEFRFSTLSDAGEISMSVLYDPDDSTHTGLTTLMVTPAEVAVVLSFADGTASTYTAQGFVTGFSPNGMEVENNLGADVSVKLTGAITIA